MLVGMAARRAAKLARKSKKGEATAYRHVILLYHFCIHKESAKKAEKRLTGKARHGSKGLVFVCGEKVLATMTVPKNNMGKGLPNYFFPQYILPVRYWPNQSFLNV